MHYKCINGLLEIHNWAFKKILFSTMYETTVYPFAGEMGLSRSSIYDVEKSHLFDYLHIEHIINIYQSTFQRRIFSFTIELVMVQILWQFFMFRQRLIELCSSVFCVKTDENHFIL